MMGQYKLIGLATMLTITLTACSQNKTIKEDNALIIPPSLKMPTDVSNGKSTGSTPKKQTKKQVIRTTSNKPTTRKNISRNAKDYYVVVGTYPSQEQAMDTFVRLSSIGLPNSTMETRTTKAGQRLHMVRLGPFQDQTKIDKVKDSLLSDGLSQFKVVEN